MDNTFTSYKMEDRSYVSYIKREIHNRVTRARFGAHKIGQIDIIVSEMTSNIIKHAGGGELLVRVRTDDDSPVVEVISIDNGPGMTDTTRMLRDGVSTTRTLGQGLGAVSRLSDVSQLYSIPKWGTIHYAMVKGTPDSSFIPEKKPIEIRALCVNKPREEVCGDGFSIKRNLPEMTIFFADGLGHGIHARAAVEAASEIFLETSEKDPVGVIRALHQNIRKTRGLVGVVAVADHRQREWRICGVGNIITRIYSGVGHRNYMSYNGTIGLTIPNAMNISTYPMETNQHLVMCSDGIQTRWDMSRYPAILKYDNIMLAAAIYKDYARGTDDASVIIAKVA